MPSKAALWTGRILSGFIILFMLVDGFGHTLRFPVYVNGTVQAGYPDRTVAPIGVEELAGAILYAIPQTSVLGAILLTAHFGGATATHVRASQPFFFPIVFGILTWLGLYLREPRLRALVPVKR